MPGVQRQEEGAQEGRPGKKTALLTSPGKFGDILWCLPAARDLAAVGYEVDFATMPKYAAIHSLLREQPYLNRVFGIEGWEQAHDWCGAQPYRPPSNEVAFCNYDVVRHLGYRGRPPAPLVSLAYTHLLDLGVEMRLPPLPFLALSRRSQSIGPRVAVGFNEMHQAEKCAFAEELLEPFEEYVRVDDVGKEEFLRAAETIAGCDVFVGCRSSLYVIAHGLGKRIITVEPERGRRERIFSCPWGTEALFEGPGEVNRAYRILRRWLDESP